MYKILLIEDDRSIQQMLKEYFLLKNKSLFTIDSAFDGQSGLEKLYENTYDLLLLDINLPDCNGFEICKEIRKHSDIPVMFITARLAQEDILKGYTLGCDDYIVKPFSLPVFYEKSLALIKRAKGLVRSNVLTAGTLSLNPNNSKVISDGKEIRLTATEYDILKLLLENKNTVVTREKIIMTVWGYDCDTDERVLDTHIKNLRKRLGANAKYLKTVVRKGYRIEE